MMHRVLLAYGLLVVALIGVLGAIFLPHTLAQSANDFSLEVTPSPLVTTVKPGQTTELELKIRNATSKPEELKIEPRSFSIDTSSEEVRLDDTTPPDISDWISFSSPTFTVQPGEWFTQKVRLSMPKDSGFSYSFALVISRKDEPKPTNAGRLIKGSLAVFTLVNVDRPGATRKIDIGQFIATKRVYEYLPAELNVRLKNTGNTIVQPYGNIFIQRNSTDESPISTLAVNETKGYILPGSVRTLKTNWESGFPSYEASKDGDGSKKNLVWDWANVSQFRIGRYTAKLVAVYNDGQRDVPMQAEVSFWVIPWKMLLVFLLVLLFVGFGIWSFVRKALRVVRKKKPKQD